MSSISHPYALSTANRTDWQDALVACIVPLEHAMRRNQLNIVINRQTGFQIQYFGVNVPSV